MGRLREVNRGASNWTEYDFDDRGYLSHSETNGYPVTYLNDAAGRVEAITYPYGQVIEYDYDDANAVTAIDARQGVNTLNVADYDYDTMGRLTHVGFDDGGSTTYTYDPIGRLETHDLEHSSGDINLTTLDYNPASQIVSRSVSNSLYQTALPTSSPNQYTPNNLNQYASVDNGNPLNYDPNGNLTAYDGWSYTFDAHNRMKSANGPGTSLTLNYDPTGRLFSTTLGSSTTEYAYSGAQLIGEFTQSGSPLNLYVYAPGSDIPIARFSGSQGLSDFQYLRSDERGSIVAETDGPTVLASHQYDVYGVPLNQSDSLFRYTGQMLLPGTELYHYKARVYYPSLGRFLQTDPIGYGDGMNMYAYVKNDPVNSVDPNGLAKVCSTATGSRVNHCVSVDGNGDGDVTDNDLTYSQRSTLSNDFGTFIQNNSGRDISASGAQVLGQENDQTRFIRAVSQFVGDAMGGWDGISIYVQDTNWLKWAFHPNHIDSATRGHSEPLQTMIGINSDVPSTFAKAGNAGRTLIHERLHFRRGAAILRPKQHKELDAEARRLLKSYGLGDGGCESIGGYFGYFVTYPACN